MKIFGWKARMKKLEFENTHLRNERDELMAEARPEIEEMVKELKSHGWQELVPHLRRSEGGTVETEGRK